MHAAPTPLPGQEPPVQDPNPFTPPKPVQDPGAPPPTHRDPGDAPPVDEPEPIKP